MGDITTMTDEEKQNNLLDNIVGREKEIHSYQMNIDSYTHTLANLPEEWTDDVAKYKGMSVAQMAEAGITPDAIVKVAQLQLRTRLSMQIITEYAQQATAQAAYDALISKFDPAALPDLLQTYIADKTEAPAA